MIHVLHVRRKLCTSICRLPTFTRESDRADEFALVHCNSYADGYWTDIMRTFCTGETDDRQSRMYDAVFAARRTALKAIRPGARASEVDRAASEVLSKHGFAEEFKHDLGHGVGFAAINHNARPHQRSASGDMLEIGMVFNIEPATYFDNYGGLRHCLVRQHSRVVCSVLYDAYFYQRTW